MHNQASAGVLLVEDDDIDAAMVMRATAATEFPVHRVKDGSEALDYLRIGASSNATPATELVLLDLNIPGIDGHEVLAQMKADPALRRIPVIVLSSSELDRDIARAYDSCAAAFLQKPIGKEGYSRLVKAVEDFWLKLVVHPSY